MSRVEWVGQDEISELLDVATAACTYCGGAARVPEDVAAVIEAGDLKTPIVVCPECGPRFAADMRRSIEDEG